MLAVLASGGAWLALRPADEGTPPPSAAGSIESVDPPPVADGRESPERSRVAPVRDARDGSGPEPRSRVAPEQTAAGPAVSRVAIPAIGVDAPMIELGLSADDSLEVPAEADETGWWSGGAFPGEAGTAVVAGHVDSTAGPAVFFRLGDLAPGDEVEVIRRDGRVARFVVERSESVAKDAFPTRRVYTATEGPSLRLITCGGEFSESSGHYESNLIVYARPA